MANILLIDDDAALRGLLAEALRRGGHAVLQAEDGRQGVELFDVAPVDLIVTDLIMPEREGIEIIVQLHRDHPELPIIAISGGLANSPVYLQLAVKLGARRALAKPFSPSELLRAVDDVLRAAARP
jgi:DNA-binding response OmpR family regulator